MFVDLPLQLTSLDMDIVSEECKSFANTVFLKKSMYYNMRSRIVKRHAGHVVRKARGKTHSSVLLTARTVDGLASDCFPGPADGLHFAAFVELQAFRVHYVPTRRLFPRLVDVVVEGCPSPPHESTLSHI